MNKLPIAAALAGVLAVGSAQAVVIDDFSGDTFLSTAPLTDATAGSSSSGYARTVDATTSDPNTTVHLNTGANPDVYGHGQDPGVTGFSAVSFDVGGIDLTAEGHNALRVDVVSSDLGGAFGVAVDGVSVTLDTTPFLLALISSGGTPVAADFLYSDFSGVDFTSVSTLEVFVDGNSQPALDMVLDNFGTACSANDQAAGGSGNSGVSEGTSSTLCVSAPTPTPTPGVPEPGVLALLGLGLVGTMGLRRRKQS